MAQLSRVLIVLVKDPSLVPSTTRQLTLVSDSSVRKPEAALFHPPVENQAWTHKQAEYPHTEKRI